MIFCTFYGGAVWGNGEKMHLGMNSVSLHHVRGIHCILCAHIIHTFVSLCYLFYFLLKKQGLIAISYYFNSTIYLFQKTWIIYTIENYYWWIYTLFHNIYSQLFYILGVNPCKTLNIFFQKQCNILLPSVKLPSYHLAMLSNSQNVHSAYTMKKFTLF